jgi:hypothetical protein
MAHLFFFDPHNLLYFVNKKLNGVRTKLGVFLQKVLYSCHYKDPYKPLINLGKTYEGCEFHLMG